VDGEWVGLFCGVGGINVMGNLWWRVARACLRTLSGDIEGCSWVDDNVAGSEFFRCVLSLRGSRDRTEGLDLSCVRLLDEYIYTYS
jgi:hypothetical protein